MFSLDSRFLRSISDPLIIMDTDHKILFINEKGAGIYGSTEQAATGRICYEVFKKTYEHCKDCPVEEVLKNRKSFFTEQSEVMPDGRRIYGEVRSYPVFNDDNELIAVSTIAIDITDKKKRQKEYAAFLSRQITEKAFNKTQKDEASGIRVSLSDRETEVLRLVAGGCSNPEIADTLCISLNTVKTHITHIFNKLGINDRTLAAVRASKMNLI